MEEYIDNMSIFLKRYTGNEERINAIKSHLIEVIGGTGAKNFIESAEYRQELIELKTKLEKPFSENSDVPIAEDLKLIELVAIHEYMGPNPEEFINAIDVTEYLDDELKFVNESPVIEIKNVEIDSETKQIQMIINFDIGYTLLEISDIMIEREFIFHQDKKTVTHEYFELPKKIQSSGLAKKILSNSINWYESHGIDEISLHANITVGGYAWAIYGFGWDEDTIKKEYLNKSKDYCVADFNFIYQKDAEELNLNEMYFYEPFDEEWDHKTGLGKRSEAIEILNKFLKENDSHIHFDVTRILQNGLRKIKSALKFLPIEDSERYIDEYKKFLIDPLSVTPQDIALFGRNGPKFHRFEEKYICEDNLENFIEKGNFSFLEIEEIRKYSFHLGKIALYKNNWMGKIDLKKDEGNGENFTILKAYLNRK